MNLQSTQHTPISSAISSAFATVEPRPVFLTVDQFSERNPAFTSPTLRNLIFKAEARQYSKGKIPGNGLLECGAILRVGRKVQIDETRFFEWVRQQNEAR